MLRSSLSICPPPKTFPRPPAFRSIWRQPVTVMVCTFVLLPFSVIRFACNSAVRQTGWFCLRFNCIVVAGLSEHEQANVYAYRSNTLDLYVHLPTDRPTHGETAISAPNKRQRKCVHEWPHKRRFDRCNYTHRQAIIELRLAGSQHDLACAIYCGVFTVEATADVVGVVAPDDGARIVGSDVYTVPLRVLVQRSRKNFRWICL